MNKATTKKLDSYYVCSLFNGHDLSKVNEVIKNGEKFAEVKLSHCVCKTMDFKIQSELNTALCESYNSTLGAFCKKVGPNTFIVSYKI